MSTMITADCINCGACEPECPNSAIREGDTAYVINPALCTECVGFYGAEMCQEVCPVACCLPNQTLRENEDTLYQRAVKMHGAAELPAKDAMDGETSRFRNDDWDNEIDDDAEPAEDFSPYWED
jgi:Fe-S-cluster-containing hydrogenase component 2